MKHWAWRDWLALTFIAVVAVVALAKCAGAEPCYPSAEAARAVHPTAHLSWTERDGHRRYYVGHPRAGVKCDMGKVAGAVPTPRPRPDLELEAALREPRADPAEGRRFADEFLPPKVSPAFIDSSWDGMFLRRFQKGATMAMGGGK